MSIEDVLNQAKTRIAALTAALQDGVGEDVTYDEDFERMKAEIEKLQSVDGGKIEWPILRDYGRELLETRSKDFRVALYWAAASAALGGLQGALDGLVLIQELTALYWEPMYPSLKRPRARGNMTTWYSESVAPFLNASSPTSRDLCLAIDEVSRALDDDLRARLTDTYGQMNALRDAARNLVGRAPADPSAVVLDTAPASVHAAPAAPGGPSADAIVDSSSAFEVLQSVSALFFKAAEVLLAANATDANGFRFSRLGAWLMLSEQDVASAVPPRANAVESVRAQAAAENWLELANNADIVTTQAPLWFDGVRFLVQALDNLGSDYAAAKTQVLGETVGLLARFPGILERNFVDGTPLADEETRAWAVSLQAGAGSSETAAGPAASAGNPLERAAREARKLATSDQFNLAVSLLSKTIKESATGNQKFRARLELAKLCIDFNAFDTAVPQLEVLERWITKHHLMDWDPVLCTQVYAHLYRGLRATAANSMDPDSGRRLAQVFERLTELDAAEALRLASS